MFKGSPYLDFFRYGEAYPSNSIDHLLEGCELDLGIILNIYPQKILNRLYRQSRTSAG